MESISDKMQALEVPSLDGPKAIRMIERNVPKPGPGEVLIKVKAGGLNYADTMMTRGTYPYGPKPPYISGMEGSGEIVALGEGEIIHPIGTKVMGFLGYGAFAEYTVSNARMLTPLPAEWTYTQGASFATDWYTAYACLKTFGRLAPDESVLIHAAAGGVGQAAVKLAKHFGARVFATASTEEKLKVASALGADELINYVEQDFVSEVKNRTNGRGVDLILEMVGGETFKKNLSAVVPCGRIVVYGISSNEKAVIDNYDLLFDHPVELIGANLWTMSQFRPDLWMTMYSEISKLMASGIMVPHEPTSFPLKDAPEVFSNMEQRKTIGKIVLIP